MNHRWRHGDEFSSWLHPCKSRGTDTREFLAGLLWYKWDWDLAQSGGRNKEGKESEFSFSLSRVYGLSWDLTLHSSFPQTLQQRQQKSQSIWLQCNTTQIPTHTLERAGLKEAFFLWETEAGHEVSLSQSSCVDPASIFYICLHYVEVFHCLGNLNFLCRSSSKCQAPSQAADRIRLPYFLLTWGPVPLWGGERIAETLRKEALRFPRSQQELTGLDILQDCVLVCGRRKLHCFNCSSMIRMTKLC